MGIVDADVFAIFFSHHIFRSSHTLQDKLNSGKPMPAEQEAELRSRVDASAKDFEQIKKDVSTKLLMAEDHRLRMFNSMLEDYQVSEGKGRARNAVADFFFLFCVLVQVLLKTLHEKASNTLQDTVTQQKMAYEGEARSAVL